MARISGVDLPGRKHLRIALTYVYGIGPKRAAELCELTGLDGTRKAETLDENEVKSLRDIIESKYRVEGDLRRDVSLSIKRLMDLGCYRGLRHRKGLPARGQRTHTNARTRKGPRRGGVAARKR